MESGDASDEEAPPCDPKRKDLMQTEWLKVISMLFAMEAEDGLRRGAIMVVTNKIGLACAEQKSMHELGVIDSSEFFCTKRNSGRWVMYSIVSYFSEVTGKYP